LRKYPSTYSFVVGFQDVDGPSFVYGAISGRQSSQSSADDHAVLSRHVVSPRDGTAIPLKH
jgi:hypothetical protein